MEIWRDIVGYEGIYQVSNLGRVKSLNYKRTGKERILKPGKDGGGYLFVYLHKDGKRKHYTIHRLVLMTFQPVENMEQLEVDHIDTDPSNNKLENLRWCNRKENCNNSLSKIHYSEANKGENNPFYGKHHSEESRKKMSESLKGEKHPLYGKHPSEEAKKKMSEAKKGKFGIKNPTSIPVVQLTLDGELVEVYGSAKEAERNGFTSSNISMCLNGKLKTHGGYRWMKLSDYIANMNPNIRVINLFKKTYEVNER